MPKLPRLSGRLVGVTFSFEGYQANGYTNGIFKQEAQRGTFRGVDGVSGKNQNLGINSHNVVFDTNNSSSYENYGSSYGSNWGKNFGNNVEVRPLSYTVRYLIRAKP